MSSKKKVDSGYYEILFIVANKFTEDEAKQIISKVEGIINQSGAKVEYQEYWGKKKLAYPIKHNNHGYYALMEFSAEKTALDTINNALRLSNEVLRHQIVAKQKKSEAQLAKEQAIQEKIKAKQEKEQAKTQEELAKKQASESPSQPANDTSASKTGEIKELDQKLEGIINAKDLI